MEENNNSNRPGSNGPGNNGGGDNNKSPKNRQSILVVLIVTMLTMLAWNYFTGMGAGSTVITYDEFIEMLDKGEVESVELTSNQIKITAKEKNARGGDIIYTTGIMPDYQLEEKLIEADVIHSAPISDMREMVLSVIINFLLPLAFIWLIFGVVMRKMGGGGMMGMGVGKSKAKVYIEKETGVTFKDVAGEEEAKESLQEVVDFLHNPGKYAEIGAKLPKGALLVGPPGTGKTLLAKAVAGEAHVPFFSLSGSDFVEMFVGVGASRVRDLFSEAKKHSPCIIFIDEIDAIGKSRDSRYGGGNDEREQTLNQLLAEMDGFDSHTACLILGATNRPEVLDPALLRPGRFDRRIIVDRPDLKGRVDILKVHAKNVNMDETVDLDEIALATSGAVGSDLANMINEAAILAVKNKRKAVAQKDLFEAVEVVLVGKEKKDRIMSKEERRIVSYHEVGHALVSALQKDAEPVQKITIVPRTMGALGYVMQVPEEEKYLNTKKEIDAMLVGYLAGRAAEELVFETVTTGASNDIEKATRLARAMVTQYGMSEKFGLMGLETRENEYLTGRTVMNCGDATAAEVDQEVMKILKDSYEEAKRLLSENRDAMDKIAEFLIQKETITGKEFMKLFREAKGIPEPEEEETEKKAETAENPNGTAEKEAQTSQEGVADQESQVSQENAANQESQASQESTANQEAQVIRENTAEQEARTDQEDTSATDGNDEPPKPPVVIDRERR